MTVADEDYVPNDTIDTDARTDGYDTKQLESILTIPMHVQHKLCKYRLVGCSVVSNGEQYAYVVIHSDSFEIRRRNEIEPRQLAQAIYSTHTPANTKEPVSRPERKWNSDNFLSSLPRGKLVSGLLFVKCDTNYDGDSDDDVIGMDRQPGFIVEDMQMNDGGDNVETLVSDQRNDTVWSLHAAAHGQVDRDESLAAREKVFIDLVDGNQGDEYVSLSSIQSIVDEEKENLNSPNEILAGTNSHLFTSAHHIF